MNYEALRSEALLHAGKARTMAAKLFNDPQASQVDAGDLLISMAQLVDLLCVTATPAPAPLGVSVSKRGEAFEYDASDEAATPAPEPLTDERLDALAQKWAGVADVPPSRLALCREFARVIERAHGIGQGKEASK